MAPTNRKKITATQKLMLVEAMEKNPFLNSVNLSHRMYSAERKADDWKELAKRLNQVGGTVKSVSKWQKTWTDIKSLTKKKCKSSDQYVSDLNIRISAMTGLKAAEEVDSKEGIFQCIRNENADPVSSDLESSMDSSCVLATSDNHAQPGVETEASPVIETRAPPVVETRAPPVVETRAPPVVETRAPSVVETRAPPTVEDRTSTILQEEVPPLVSDQTLPEQTVAEVVVLDSNNCQKLIAAEEASGAAMKSIAIQLGQLVKAESRKATAFERTASAFERMADAIDRISNHFCT